MTETRVKKFFLNSLVISLILSALIGIILILVGSGDIQFKILFTTLSYAGFIGLGMIYREFKNKTLSIIGFALTGLEFIFALIAIWTDVSFSVFDIILVSIVMLLTQVTVLGIISFETKNRMLDNITNLTILLTYTLGIMISILVFDINAGDYYYRFMGVFAILIVLGSVIRPILKKIYHLD